ncbi:hypothetical protein K450DRAFT_250689 [Umbelopsis ramanniana AG]|uniref:Adenine DNA glycosylase n=1 Tax=Umbelopsis ramanniana AG TaxID=1314678 RepID=A0AAD5HD32_UMBRA|nr:uncharacterized protein K450DRAFT_250689 [Umbelopsis ramanniana AG]KAI8577758.1 hypothetical protein K450DRAFT_250689 [Umbelopsis ramanniana AG]
MTAPKLHRHLASYHKFSEIERQQIQKDLLKWFDLEKRTHLPWRKEFDHTLDTEQRAQRAYEVWVSEIMLQQTQVATTIPYYNKWMTSFPTIHDLAKADIETVNKLWAGLGYYSRARRLWEGAQKICRESNGVLPNTAKSLEEKVPGVGRYTAGAIASIAWGQQAGTVDGNIARVYSRLRAIGGDPKGKSTIELQWALADYMVPQDRPGDFNQALMELGATLCTPQKPDCKHCPVQKNCRALEEVKSTQKLLSSEKRVKDESDDESEVDIEECHVCLPNDIDDELSVTRYPRKAVKKAPREEECAVCIVEKKPADSKNPLDSKFLLVKRPKTGLLAGLWEFPSVELNETCVAEKKSAKKRKPSKAVVSSDDSEDDYVPEQKSGSPTLKLLAKDSDERQAIMGKHLMTTFDIDLDSCNILRRTELGSVVHLFSHIRKTYHMEYLEIDADSIDDVEDTDQVQWISRDELALAAIPTGLKKGIKLMENLATVGAEKKIKSTPRKKVKIEKDPAAGTRNLLSFFQQKPK